MKKLFCFLFVCYLFPVAYSFSQGTWTPQANLPGNPRFAAVGFSICAKGYVATGQNGGQATSAWYDDLWEWDQATNTWTQKANLPGAVRSYAVGFSIGSKGYVGTGANTWSGNIYLKDFWEWDQCTNTWTQKADFGGTARYGGVGFSIGTKGYIGTGEDISGSKNDFWEYDQATNVWIQKTNFGGIPRQIGVGLAIGNKGYIGTGYTPAWVQDFWEWNPGTNVWTQKANYSSGPRMEGVAFTIGNFGYVGTGAFSVNDFWKYDPVANTWTQMANFGGGLRELACAFSIGCYGYVGTGIVADGWSGTFKDLWEYFDPSNNTCVPVVASTVNTATICAGQNATLGVSGGGSSYNWNTGATTSSIVVSPTATTSYSVSIANGLCMCTPGVLTTTVTVVSPSAPVVSGVTICSGQAATLTATGGVNYSWNTGNTNASIVISPTATLSYTVTSGIGSCTATATATVTVGPSPATTISPATICAGQTATLTASGGGNYSWNTGNTNASIYVSPTASTTYSVLVSVGSCTATATAQVSVVPGSSAIITGNTVLCIGDIATLTASGGTNYSWSNGATSNSIPVNPTSTSTYTVTTTNGTGCSAFSTVTVTVSPPPVAAANSASICSGQIATLLASGGSNYSWNTGQTGNPLIVSPLGNSTYSVIVSVGTCSDTATCSVVVGPVPTASAWSSVTITAGGNTTLGASGGGAYLWSNGAVDSVITVSPLVTTVYCVTVVNSSGCSDTACVTVYVEPIDCTPFESADAFTLPNAFSPNTDGQNETFHLLYGSLLSDCVKEFSFAVYNRWGEKVFEGSQINFGWDGMYQGKPEDTGVFAWHLKAVLDNDVVVRKKGNVSLLR